MTTTEDRIKRTVKKSQQAALIALCCLIALIVYGSYRAYNLRSDLRGLEDQKAQLEKQKLQLETQKQQLERDVGKLIAVVNESEKAKLAQDSAEGIEPRAKATAVQGIKTANGDQVYDFQCWLDLSRVPEVQRQRIESVTYEFDDPTVHNKHLTSSDPSNGYAVGYRGWGAFHVVPITISFKDGKKVTLYLDMFKAIGWNAKD